MESKTHQKTRLPDAIYSSPKKNFTQINNEILHNTSLSFKAIGILCVLLSNKAGWSSHIKTLSKKYKTGVTAVTTGIQELEREGYVLRFFYAKQNGQRVGSFIAYTDKKNVFDLSSHFEYVQALNLRIYPSTKGTKKALNPENQKIQPTKNTQEPNSEKPILGFLKLGNLNLENKPLIILNSNNINNNNIKHIVPNLDNLENDSFLSGEIKNPPDYPDTNQTPSPENNKTKPPFQSPPDKGAVPATNKTPKSNKPQKSPKPKNKIYQKMAKKLGCIISAHKKINCRSNNWENDFRLLIERDLTGEKKEKTKRVFGALKFYKDHIGEKYIPVIFSGSAFRKKFIKLENAIERDKNNWNSQSTQTDTEIKPDKEGIYNPPHPGEDGYNPRETDFRRFFPTLSKYDFERTEEDLAVESDWDPEQGNMFAIWPLLREKMIQEGRLDSPEEGMFCENPYL